MPESGMTVPINSHKNVLVRFQGKGMQLHQHALAHAWDFQSAQNITCLD